MLRNVLYTWSDGAEITILHALAAALIFLLAQTVILLINRRLLGLMFKESSNQQFDQVKMRRYTRFFVNLVAIVLLLEILKVPTDFLSKSIGVSTEETGAITLGKILNVILIIYAAGGIAWLSKKFILTPFFNKKNLDQGRQHALLQFSMYVVYTLAAVFVLSQVMRDITILAGAFAGLAVGIGLGLQQTFNDLLSGIIMLVEGTIEIDDTVIVQGKQAKVKKIGLRVSTLETPDQMIWLVPNSKLVIDHVLNWSHNNNATRFSIAVGVDYKTTPKQMIQVWEEVCSSNKAVLQKPAPSVQLVAFADFSINFELFFYSNAFHNIEQIKSDLRFELFEVLKAHDIEIPFPKQVIVSSSKIDPLT